MLCDGGGSNSASRYVFKERLQGLADRLGVEIRVAHYPPYCSKYNPIEHRLFPHVTRACRGVIFRTLETVRHYMSKAGTTTGLEVEVRILEKVYETGRKCAAGFKETMRIVFDEILPKWNYRAVPRPSEIGKQGFEGGVIRLLKCSHTGRSRLSTGVDVFHTAQAGQRALGQAWARIETLLEGGRGRGPPGGSGRGVTPG